MTTETVVLRRAGHQDVGTVLDPLTHYDLPRTCFEPLYLADPTYRPARSWVADADGEPVAQARCRPAELARLLLGGATAGTAGPLRDPLPATGCRGSPTAYEGARSPRPSACPGAGRSRPGPVPVPPGSRPGSARVPGTAGPFRDTE
ncbi:hypothetical protein GCM10010145_64980 [Streptomyces ruber]|uniref:Uncharacterized protein n=2 Tax=Streptomyces TaxID=1883 RepID=A0A918BRL4_9ACTN|nr:hypothetical protein [Streptomyces ruber]GGQ86500.1 hypothetical protein GCM10010145_64980 [Streptomyces ruber]